MRRYLGLLITLTLPLAGTVCGQTPAVVVPLPSITLFERQGNAIPIRKGYEHTGAGNINVSQPGNDAVTASITRDKGVKNIYTIHKPTTDEVVVTMTGVAVATACPWKDSLSGMDFDFIQCFEVAGPVTPDKKLKLTAQARVIGLLRSTKLGPSSAEEFGSATIDCGDVEIIRVSTPAHCVSCGECLSINDHEGPAAALVVPGKYTLHQTFHIQASHPRTALAAKSSSAEFAPDPALDPLWISSWEPFHGAKKKDFGFQVIIKVTTE